MEHQLVTDFDRVWSAYPRKVGKAVARKAFAKINPRPALVEKMLSTLEWQSKMPQWTRDGGQYIPHLSTWLNQERWDDEPFFTTDKRQDRLSGLREFIDG